MLSDPQTVADLREAEESRAAGEVFSTEEILAEVAARTALTARMTEPSYAVVWSVPGLCRSPSARRYR